MTPKIMSILVPAYIAPKYVGQTPDVFPPKVIEAWEKSLCQRAVGVVKHKPTELLSFDGLNGAVMRKVVIRYDFHHANDTETAEIIGVALTTFDIGQISVLMQDAQAEIFTANEVEEFALGAHAWTEQ